MIKDMDKKADVRHRVVLNRLSAVESRIDSLSAEIQKLKGIGGHTTKFGTADVNTGTNENGGKAEPMTPEAKILKNRNFGSIGKKSS